MTKPVEPSVRTDNQRGTPFTRHEAVRIQEFVRKCGIPVVNVDHFVLKPRCVEAVLKSGARRVLTPAWYG